MNQNALPMMKARLNRLAEDTRLDAYLTARLNAAEDELSKCGITLDDESPSDLMLLVDYAVWRYHNRDSNSGMPDWLRLTRRERWIQEREADAT